MRETCKAGIRDAYGEDLTEREIDALIADIEHRAKAMRARDASLTLSDALEKAAKNFAGEAELRAIAQQRATYLNFRALAHSLGYIRQTWKHNPGEGAKVILVGDQSGKLGARESVGGEQHALHNRYLMGAVASLDAAAPDGLALFKQGVHERDMAHALWRISEGYEGKRPPDFSGLHPIAVKLAQAVHLWTETARLDANAAGAWIGHTLGYVTRQTHDANSIAAAKADWIADARDWFDWERMGVYSPEAREDALAGYWQSLSSGVHLSEPGTAAPGRGLTGKARALSSEREIHFKDADAFLAYNQKYGTGSLPETIYATLSRSARATGLMRKLGPNHELTFHNLEQRLLRDVREAGGDEAKLQRQFDTLRTRHLANLDGSLDVPGSETGAQAAAAVRTWQNMSALGKITLSSFADTGTVALSANKVGGSALNALGHALGALFDGAPKGERLSLYADMGLAIESMIGHTANRFGLSDEMSVRGIYGSLGRAQEVFWKWSGQRHWTDSVRRGVADFLSSQVVRRVGQTYDQLDAELRRTFGQYGIDAGKWDIVRRATPQSVEGRDFLTPKMLDNVADEHYTAYLDAAGVASGEKHVKALREELKRQLRLFYVDQNGYFLLTPDAATTGLMKLGTQRGSWLGEGVRFIMQFKSYPIAYSQRILGRAIAQDGLRGVMQAVAFTTIAGYVAMTAKDLSKGLPPRDPRAHPIKTTLAAMTHGGSFGILGDIATSQVTDRHQEAALSIFGPTVGDVIGDRGIAGLMAKAAKGEDASAATVRFVQSNTPFINLFYVKPILDYAFLYELQEWANPGALKRMERRIEKDTGQTYLLKPSETVK